MGRVGSRLREATLRVSYADQTIRPHYHAMHQPLHAKGIFDTMRDRARKGSWKNLPLPDEHVSLSAEWAFSETEFEKLRRGLVPEIMEDKWFIFYESGWLNFHRSWSGVCIYRMKVAQRDDIYETQQILVNRAPEQYSCVDDAYDLQLLKHLIDRMLLGRASSAPIPASLQGAVDPSIYRHHVVGYDRSNDEIEQDSG